MEQLGPPIIYPKLEKFEHALRKKLQTFGIINLFIFHEPDVQINRLLTQQ
jgi:hypothetical protein